MYAEEQQQEQPYPIANYQSEHNNEGSIKFQLSFDDLIEDIEHTLLCQEPFQDSETGVLGWRTPEGTVPLINQHGMVRIRAIIRSKLNRNAPLSDLEEEEIKGICREVEHNVVNTLYDNWDAFDLLDVSAATTIRETIGDSIFINLKKANHGRFLRHLRSTHHSTEVNSIARSGMVKNVKDSDGGVFAKLFGK